MTMKPIDFHAQAVEAERVRQQKQDREQREAWAKEAAELARPKAEGRIVRIKSRRRNRKALSSIGRRSGKSSGSTSQRQSGLRRQPTCRVSWLSRNDARLFENLVEVCDVPGEDLSALKDLS